jgi:hypothetical protein
VSALYPGETERQHHQRAHIRSAPDVAEAVRRAARHVGVTVEHDYQANAIAEAARSFADTVIGNRRAAARFQWENEGFRDYTRQDLRRELLDTITRQGLLPVSLPRETIRYTAGFPDAGGLREVPESADWQTVIVEIEVGVRTPPVDREAAVKAGILNGT